MIALLRYEAAILLRSHRWMFPLIAYGALILTGTAGGTPVGPPWLSLADGLDWSAAVLIPVLAFLTRSMLTAEPDASRACVCAATSPVRTQLATLLVALGGGVVLGVVGACFEVLLNPAVTGRSGGLLGNVGAALAHPVTLAAGLAMTAVCAAGRLGRRRAVQPAAAAAPGHGHARHARGGGVRARLGRVAGRGGAAAREQRVLAALAGRRPGTRRRLPARGHLDGVGAGGRPPRKRLGFHVAEAQVRCGPGGHGPPMWPGGP